MAWLRRGAELCLGGEADALVTAPVNKQGHRAQRDAFRGADGVPLRHRPRAGHRNDCCWGTTTAGRWLRVALATTHLALKDVPARLTLDRIDGPSKRATEAMPRPRLSSARIGVCGLNPHGAKGRIGVTKKPASSLPPWRRRGAGCGRDGPLPADTLFHRAYRGDFDAVVAMYHDQGLPPLKMVAF
jgi:4-hydroxythreonine-4-phosphate dehydrogenase